MSETLIEFENVTFRYESDDEGVMLPPAVENLSFKINQGEFVAILGHNGSGKSTVAKLSNGLLIPESGKVIVDGIDTKSEEDEIAVKQTVGVVFQNPDNQIVATIVEEDVAFGPENLGIEPSQIRERVDEALKIVGMYDYRKHEPHKLSGGQKQRVAIAGILAMKPRCIVLDEPTAMLDPIGRRDVMNAIKRLNRELNITVIYITHYMEEACEAQRVIVMDDAKLLMDATPKEVFLQSKKIREIGLDVPQTCNLAEMLKKSGVKLQNDLLSIDELVNNIVEILEATPRNQ